MKKIITRMNELKMTVAIAMFFFSGVSLNAQAPVVTTNAANGNDYTFNVSAPGNLKLALEALKAGFNFTGDQKDNFIINGALNADDVTYFSAKGTGWPVNSWSLNKLDLSGATITALLDEQFDGTKNIKEIILPNSLEVVPFKAFAGCTSVTKGAGVTTIGQNCYSWSRWTTLGTFDAKTLFPVLTTLQNEAFAYNDGAADFTGIILPATFTTFGNNVFLQCPNLASVQIHATTPPALGSFGNRDAMTWNGTEYVTVPAAGITLYVPESAVDTYKATQAYADYFGVDNIKKIEDTTTKISETNSNNNELKVSVSNGKLVLLNSIDPVFVKVFGLNGSLINSEMITTVSTFTLNKGAYIVKAGTCSLKVII